MLRLLIVASLVSLTASTALVYAGDKEDVQAAAQKLADSKNYSWTTNSEGGGGGGGFGAGGASGQTQPDGLTMILFDMRDAQARVFLKGDKAAVETPDQGWQAMNVDQDRRERREERRERDPNAPGAAAGGGGGAGGGGAAGGGGGAGGGPGDGRDPTRMIGGMLRNYQAPGAQAAHLASAAQDVKKNADGSYTATLSEDEARALMQRRVGRRMGDGQGQGPGAGAGGGAGGGAGAGGRGGPEVKDPKATVTFWTDPAGQLNKFQFHMTGTMSGRDGQERPIDRTTTVEFKDIGTTKIDVPEEAKAKLQ